MLGLVGLAVKPPVQTVMGVMVNLRADILANVAHKLDEACADLIMNGTGVDYPTGILRVED